MGRLVGRILWFLVFLLGSTLVLWGLLQDQLTVLSDDSILLIQTRSPSPSRVYSIHSTTATPQPPANQTSPGRLYRHLKAPKSNRIWPEMHEREDRIIAQVNLIPDNPKYDDPAEEKVILTYFGAPNGVPIGRQKFITDGCPVQNCRVTEDRNMLAEAHAVVFEGSFLDEGLKKRPGQIWILFLLESPENTASLKAAGVMYNWTATYRLDSTINTPYERFVPYANATEPLPPRNYAKGKTKMVAWFVSNCGAVNRRGNYAAELAKYVQVDVYGACGNLTCLRHQNKCNQMLSEDYKFYLAFENSNCRDYITEKFYWNALYNDVVPIVMGAHPDDYAQVAPPGSYIHVDDFESPRHLADYLHKLDQNDTMYNQYFRWKGTGEFIDTKYWCRLCSLVHEAYSGRAPLAMWYADVDSWWNGPGVCVRPGDNERWATWRNQNYSQFGDVFARPNTLNVIHENAQ